MDKQQQQLVTQLEREQFVYMRNELINDMEYKLSKQHLLLLRYMIKQIQRGDTPDKIYSISIRNFCRVLNIDASGYNYKDIKKAFNRIDSETKWFDTDTDITRVKWLDELRIRKNLGTIEYSFHKSITPYLFDLINSKEGYTKYLFDDVIMLDTKHGIHLYEFLREHYNAKHRYVNASLEYLIKKLAPDTNYTEFKYFNRDILKKAVEEINRYQYFRVSYKGMAAKGSRAYTYVRFTLEDVEEGTAEYWITNDIRAEKMGLSLID